MKAVIITLYQANYSRLADVVLPNWREYAARHGYDVVAGPEGPGRDVLSLGFRKAALTREILFETANNWDAALVMDLDVLVTNLTVPLTDFVDSDHHYFVTTGFNGLCNGTHIIRKTPEGKEIIDAIIANRGGYSNEQDVIKGSLDRAPFAGRIKFSPYTSFGSFRLDLYPEHAPATREKGQWQQGDFLLHLAAKPLDERIRIFSEMQEAIVR